MSVPGDPPPQLGAVAEHSVSDLIERFHRSAVWVPVCFERRWSRCTDQDCFGCALCAVASNVTSEGLSERNELQSQGHKSVVSCSSYEHGATLVERGDFDLVVVSQGSTAFEGDPELLESCAR